MRTQRKGRRRTTRLFPKKKDRPPLSDEPPRERSDPTTLALLAETPRKLLRPHHPRPPPPLPYSPPLATAAPRPLPPAPPLLLSHPSSLLSPRFRRAHWACVPAPSGEWARRKAPRARRDEAARSRPGRRAGRRDRRRATSPPDRPLPRSLCSRGAPYRSVLDRRSTAARPSSIATSAVERRHRNAATNASPRDERPGSGDGRRRSPARARGQGT